MKTDASQKLLLGAPKAAEALSISARTLWALTSPRGPIPAVRIGNARVYSEGDLQFVASELRQIDAEKGGGNERQDPDGAVLVITERQAAQFCRNARKALRDGASRTEAAQEAIRKLKQNRRGGRCATHAACRPESNRGKEATQ